MTYTFQKACSLVTDVLPAAENKIQRGGMPSVVTGLVVHQFRADELRFDVHIGSLINSFTQPGDRIASAHFAVEGKRVVQFVDLKDRAFHAGAAGNDHWSIEVFGGMDETTLATVAALIRELERIAGRELTLYRHNALMATSCGTHVDLAKIRALVGATQGKEAATMVRPVAAVHKTSQPFGSYATAGVVGNPNGSTVQQLVAMYGNYQPFGHAGEDIACPIGTPVYAIADGEVVWADWATNLPGDDSDLGYRRRWYFYKGFPGILTVIKHPQLGPNVYTAYAHLSDNNMAPVGTKVRAGQLIAKSGNTGGVAPHLHVEYLVDPTYSSSGGFIYGRKNPALLYGIPAATTQGGSTLSSAEVTEIKNYIHALLIGGYTSGGKAHPGVAMVAEENQRRIGRVLTAVEGVPAATSEAVWSDRKVRRAGGDVAAIQELANVNTKLDALAPAISGLPAALSAAVAQAVEANLPEVIAAEIPDDLAQGVIDALAARLTLTKDAPPTA
ncbi:endolysin [Arthrobacter phage Tweety19]|uniref:Endolysin n=1 Tax=Arthrobacter phage Tweety19 TaxID=2768133 RepID=A0A7G9W222_9CAUD|nr:tail length tape measure protein [Arthrobacter phage Tweety19]QNO12685.1 endolysin [Arthrobacter phage Tweety19]